MKIQFSEKTVLKGTATLIKSMFYQKELAI